MRPDLTLEYLNDRAAEFIGLTVADANKIGWTELIHPDDRVTTLDRVATPLAQGDPHEVEFRFRHHSGEYRWVVSRAVPLRDEVGRLVRWIGITEDVHERRLAVAELYRSERRYQVLTEAAPQVVWTRGEGTAGAQEWWQEITGQSPDESCGWGWLDAVHPDDAPRARALWEQALENGTSYDVEYRVRLRDGNYLDLLVRAVALKDSTGQVTEWVGTFTDISERKEGERALRALNYRLEDEIEARTRSVREHQARFRGAFDQAPIGMALVAPDGRWLEVNRALCELVGYSELELLASRFQEITHPDDLAKDLKYVQAMLAGEIHSYQLEKQYIHKSGRVLHALLSVSLVRNEAGEPLYFISQIKDITERKQAETELKAAKIAAEAANLAKGVFLANMSHEIRTPMNGILGMADLALSTELSDEQREYVGLIKASGEALLRVINDILDLSKIEAGRLDLEPIEFNLDDALSPSLRALAFRAAEKKLGYQLTLEPDLPRLVGDPDRLRQVMVNLVGNAIKFTEHGELEARVCRQRSSSQEVTLRFEVRDTGIGIPPEKQELVFEAFAQADASTTRTYGGTGLGLAISQRLVHMMGGELELKSAPGVGSTFWFEVTFPIGSAATKPSSPEGAFATNAAPPSLAPAVQSPLHVLLVEDDATNQALAVRFLERAGHTVQVAGNGRIALEILDHTDFDVVLMDVQMPEMDGLTATAALRERENGTGRRTWVIGLTAFAMPSDRDRCLKAGMDDYLTKPLRREQLYATLATVPRLSMPSTEEALVG